MNSYNYLLDRAMIILLSKVRKTGAGLARILQKMRGILAEKLPKTKQNRLENRQITSYYSSRRV